MKHKFLLSLRALTLLLVMSLSIGNVWGQADQTKTETFESATATTTYNSTQTITAAQSSCGIAWSVYYGSPSTTSAITGSKSCLIRYYTADAKLGYARTTTAIKGLKNITFNAKVTNTGNKMGVWYSTDSTTWTALATDVVLTTSSASKSYDITSPSSSTKYWVKIGLSTGCSTNKKDLIIDDICFTYNEGGGSTPVAPSITTDPIGASYEKDATPAALTVVASGNPTPTFQWYSNTASGTTGASPISGATTASYSPSTTNVGTTYYYCVASNSEGNATSDIVAIQVNEHTVTPGKYNIVPNNTFWGNTQSGSVTVEKNTAFGPKTQNDITVSMNSGNSTSSYINSSSCRVYNGYTFTVAVPSGYLITAISFTGNTWVAPTASVGTMNSKDWTGSAPSVTFTFSGTSYMTNIEVTYAAEVSSPVTFSNPDHGTLAIKNGDDAIATGDNIKMGTELTVNVTAESDAYRLDSVKVIKTGADPEEDVTATVYNKSTGKITMPAYAITVSAVMEANNYDVTFHSNTTPAQDDYKQTFTYTVAANLTANTFTAPTGYEFYKWATTAEGEGTIADKAEYTLPSAADADLYAKWNAKNISVTLDKNGSSADGLALINYDATEVGDIEHVAAWAAHTLKGYYTAASAGDKVLTAEGEFAGNVEGWIVDGKWAKSEDCTLYAQWESAENYNISYDLTGCTADAGNPTEIALSAEDVTLNFDLGANRTWTGANVAVSMGGASVSSDDYTFENGALWIVPTGGFNGDVTVTIVCQYAPATLTLSENGSESSYGSNLKVNDEVTLPNCEVQCDKVFVGWSEKNADITASDVLAVGTSYTLPATSNKLYAVFATETPGETTDVYTMNITKNTSNSAYATYYDVTFSSIGWKMPGNQNIGAYVKLGGKFSTDSRYIYSKNAISSGVDKVIANHGTKDDAITVNSVTLDVYSTAALAAAGATGDISSVAGTYVDNGNTTFERPSTADWKGRFYRITYNMSSSASGSNKGIILYSVKMQSVAAPTYSEYAVTCSAKTAAPEFSLTAGEYTVAKELIITAAEGTIHFTEDGTTPDENSPEYTQPIQLDKWGTKTIKAIAIADGKSASDIVSATYVMNLPFASLEALVAADVPSGSTVTVSFSDVEITSLNGTNGVSLNVQKEEQNIQIYCNSVARPDTYVKGGKLSATNLSSSWVRYSQSGTFKCWELTPSNWDGFEYTNPAHITSIVISGEPNKKSYSDGQTLESDGLVVTGYYDDHTELAPHKETITEGLTWTLPTLTKDQTSAEVTVKYTEPILSTELTSEAYQVTGLSVSAAKVLQSIYVADDSEHQTKFFVGRPFSSEGLKVMAKYNIGDDEPVTPSSISTPTMTSEGQQTVTITYTENTVEQQTSYEITLAYMDLDDLVAATDIQKDDYVYVKITDQMIKSFYTSGGSNKGIFFDIQKESNDIEIYANGTNCPNTWEQYGTVSATLDNVQWTKYGDTWELKPSNWNAFTYTAPNIPVTAMEVDPSSVEVAELGSTTLNINYTPEHATNKGVTWAVTEGDEYASVNATTGEVSGLKPGSAIVTATLTADPTIQATCSVTVTATPKCTISYVVKGSEVHTQAIARESKSTIDYVPDLVVSGYDFYGWSETTLAEEAASATIITEYTPGAEEATKTLYAIYKRIDDSSATFHKYAKVTSAPANWVGTYVIGYNATTFANGKTGGNDGIGAANASVNPGEALSNDVVTEAWGNEYKVTIEACTNGYLLKTQDGKYNYQTSNANGIATSTYATTADDYPITITLNQSGTVNMAVPAKPAFCYNTNGYFRFYKDGGNNNIYLYKYDEGAAFYTSEPTAKVKVIFNLDGGAGGCGNITVNQGEDVEICEAIPTKNLYKFNTWSDGVNNYAPGATIENVTENIELTALWTAKVQYTISFNKAGAAGTTPASITDYEGNQVNLPVQGDLSNPGYIFSGWSDGETTRGGGAAYIMPEKNVNMTAVWTAKTNDKWYRVESASQLEVGKEYAVVANTLESPMAMGDLAVVGGETKDYMSYVAAAFNEDKSMMTAINPSAVILTLGGDAENGWTLTKNGRFLGSEATKSMSWTDEIGEKTGYKWTITIDAEDNYNASMSPEGDYLRYNSSSPRFTTYGSSTTTMTDVQLYVKVPAQEVSGDVDASTITENADVTVVDGGNLVMNESKELGDVYVMAGGKITLQATTKLTVQNFVIKSTMAGGTSGQVAGVTSTNLVIEGDAYYDVTLDGNADPDKWHAVGVPFDVDAINGIYDMDDNKLTNEQNYAVMVYQGDVRAQGKYGWIKLHKTSDKIMHPGVFYLFGVDGAHGTTYRFRKVNGQFSVASKSIMAYEYPQTSGVATDAGWNGIANNQLEYSSIDKKVQVLNISSYTFEAKNASSTNFTVGTPFFYQAEGTGYVTLVTGEDKPAYAPVRYGAKEIKDLDVTLANEDYTDHLYISSTDEAANEYQIGRDLKKMTMTSAPVVPQIFANAYGTNLCMVDAPMVNDEAAVALKLYAPKAGEYTLAAEQTGATVYLMKGNSVVWNLSMSEYTIELPKGNTEEYSLIVKAPQVTTNVENILHNNENGVQKVIYRNQLYILHDGKMIDAMGQEVK